MTEKQLQAIVDTLQAQRNTALNMLAQLQGELALLKEENDALKAAAEAAKDTPK